MPLKLASKGKREEFNYYDLLLEDIPILLATLLAEGFQEEYFFGFSITRTGQLSINVTDQRKNSEKQYFSNYKELQHWLNEVTGGVGVGDEEPETKSKAPRR